MAPPPEARPTDSIVSIMSPSSSEYKIDDTPLESPDEKFKLEDLKEAHASQSGLEQHKGHDKISADQPKKGKRKLPAFFDHFTIEELKVLFRCSVALWATGFLIWCLPALREMGTLAFFAMLVVYIIPPNGVLMTFIIGMTTALMGMLFAWAWGVIVMKAALAARPAHVLQERKAALAQLARTNPAAASVAVYNGWFLDTRVTIAFTCMVSVFIYALARLRTMNQKFLLFAIFGWITTDLYWTTGILVPTFNGLLGDSFIKPASCGMAIGLAASALIFPRSTSMLTLATLQKLMGTITGAIALNASILQTDFNDVPDMQKLEGLRAGIMMQWRALQPMLGFLPLDVSYGLWNAQDVASLRGPIRATMIAVMGMLDLEIQRGTYALKFNQLEKSQKARVEGPAVATMTHSPSKQGEEHTPGKHQLMQNMASLNTLHAGNFRSCGRETRVALAVPSGAILGTCLGALKAVTEIFVLTNDHRLLSRPKKGKVEQAHQDHIAALQQLKMQVAAYPVAATEAILSRYKDLFDESGQVSAESISSPRLLALVIGVKYEDHVIFLSHCISALLEHAILLEKERTKARFWFPTSLRKFATWIFGSPGTAELHASGGEEQPKVDKKLLAEVQGRLRTGKTTTCGKKRGNLAGTLLRLSKWLFNDDGIYALRVVVASIAVVSVQANKHAAGFFYENKALWVLIMVQLATEVYTANAVLGTILKLSGTIAGGTLGLVAWYMSSGHGPGNPYGLAVVMAPASIILMWIRLYAPPKLFFTTILTGATFALMVGFSYGDNHLHTYGSPGVGYNVFWRRTLLVIVGIAISFIVALLPYPKSASRMAARSLGNVLHATTDHYSVILKVWHDLDNEKKYIPAIAGAGLHITDTLAALMPVIGALKFEFSSSPFDQATCMKVKGLCERIVMQLTRLHIRATAMTPRLRHRFLHVTGLKEDEMVGSIMATLSVIESALKTGEPLPSRLPTPLSKKCIDRDHARAMGQLNLAELKDESYRGLCACVSAYITYLQTIDDMVIVLKEALGESHVLPEDLALLREAEDLEAGGYSDLL